MSGWLMHRQLSMVNSNNYDQTVYMFSLYFILEGSIKRENAPQIKNEQVLCSISKLPTNVSEKQMHLKANC